MTAPASATITGSWYRSAGRAAIMSGAIGIIAHGFLWAFVVRRVSGGDEQACIPLIRTHDVGVILQSLFMIPVVFMLGEIANQHSRGISRANVAVGVSALSLIILCLLLTFANVLADDIYTVPQGMLGIWLIVISWRVSSVLSRSLTWLGTVIGVGLLLVAAFPIGFAIFVDPSFGPWPFDYEPPKGTERANEILHNMFFIGSFMGVTTYPIWAVLVGRRLLRTGNLVTKGVTSAGVV